MVELAEIQVAYYMVAATGVLIAAAYYVLNMRATLQTRQAFNSCAGFHGDAAKDTHVY